MSTETFVKKPLARSNPIPLSKFIEDDGSMGSGAEKGVRLYKSSPNHWTLQIRTRTEKTMRIATVAMTVEEIRRLTWATLQG